MNNPQFILGDCLNIPLADKSVDLVFCSPPYEAARTYGIDFALKGQDWVDWAVPRFMECLRVCKGLVAWVVEGQTRNYRYSAAPILFMADLHRKGVHLRKPPAFRRVGIPGSGGPDWLRNDYEFIVCAGPGGKLPWSDNTACGHPPKWAPGGEMSHRISDGARVNQWGKNGSPRGMGNRNADGTFDSRVRPSHVTTMKVFSSDKRAHTKSRADGTDEVQYYAPPVLANPGNVIQQTYTAEQVNAMLTDRGDTIDCTVGGGHLGSHLAHENEAPFPEKLAEFFIKSFCPPGGITLDVFSGSGTTACVAARLGRQGIGMDIRASQIELGERRAKEVA